ncbi:MAG: P1 family peptidase [Acidobacteriota bacterium]|nr:P1 family peptidase [Acidobacteriota bacterium]
MAVLRPIELGLTIGRLEPGPRDAITDVRGVRVGHCTLIDPDRRLRTGVTIIRPCDDPWTERPIAAYDVLNGFGKSVGLPQLAELGELETPIGLTNTLAVWTVARRLAELTARRDPRIWSVNPVVGECNDGALSDIAAFPITDSHVDAALDAASAEVAEGDVGAGAGTRAWGYKAGIGTASRVAASGAGRYVVGVLTLPNTGRREDLRIGGFPVGALMLGPPTAPEGKSGSIMMVLATDAPVDARQLRRLAKRCALGLARVGGTASHGSGDFTIAFAPRREERLRDGELTPLFEAAVEATEAAIIHGLFASRDAVDREGAPVPALPAREVVARVHAARAALIGDRI